MRKEGAVIALISILEIARWEQLPGPTTGQKARPKVPTEAAVTMMILVCAQDSFSEKSLPARVAPAAQQRAASQPFTACSSYSQDYPAYALPPRAAAPTAEAPRSSIPLDATTTYQVWPSRNA